MHLPKLIALTVCSGLFSAASFTLTTASLAQKATAEDCTQSVETTWLESYPVKAATQGECGLGELTLTISNQNGDVEFANTYGPDDLFGFYDIATFDGMHLALTDWIVNYADQSSSSRLPPWPEGAEGPEAGEFPFYPEDGVSRELYEAVRAEDRPMICFIQGTESLLCLVKNPKNSDLQAIGVQSFPG